jgi:hypothetical protein
MASGREGKFKCRQDGMLGEEENIIALHLHLLRPAVLEAAAT